MSLLKERISQEIEWRTAEIVTLKMLPLHSYLSDKQKQILRKHIIPAFYALWEGFVKDAFKHYAEEINRLNITMDEIALELLTYTFDIQYIKNTAYLHEVPKDFKGKTERITKFFNDFKESVNANIVNIPTDLPKSNNINYKMINDILMQFNLEALNIEFAKKLDKLFKFRNDFAHGDFSIPVENKEINEFSQLIIDLMSEVFLKIIDGYENKTYLAK